MCVGLQKDFHQASSYFRLENLMRFFISRADSMSQGGHYKKKSYYRKQIQAYLNACLEKGWAKLAFIEQ